MNAKHLFPGVAFVIAGMLSSPSVAWSATTPPGTNRIVHWLNSKSLPHLNTVQAEAYVQRHQRRPEALLAAYQATTDRGFLREAMAKHPRDTRVTFAAACSSASAQSNPDDAQERRTWLDAFKKSAPDNALAYYLSARGHFKSGKPD